MWVDKTELCVSECVCVCGASKQKSLCRHILRQTSFWRPKKARQGLEQMLFPPSLCIALWSKKGGHCAVFLDQKISYSTMRNLQFHNMNQYRISVLSTKPYSVFCLLFSCSPNLDDPLQTFHWSLPINLYLWSVMRHFSTYFHGTELKSNKVPWGLWNSYSIAHDLDALLYPLKTVCDRFVTLHADMKHAGQTCSLDSFVKLSRCFCCIGVTSDCKLIVFFSYWWKQPSSRTSKIILHVVLMGYLLALNKYTHHEFLIMHIMSNQESVVVDY